MRAHVEETLEVILPALHAAAAADAVAETGGISSVAAVVDVA